MSRRHAYRSPITSWSLYGALATVAGLLVSYVGLRWDPLVSYLCSINLVTLVFFGLDKWLAQQESFRIPEVVLFGLVAMGGSPLGFIARHLFRHKTRKTSFRIAFWLIVVLQMAVIVAYRIWIR